MTESIIKPAALSILLFGITLPGIGSWLERGMISHLLIQLPLIVYIGLCLADQMPVRWINAINRYNAGGVTGFFVMSATGLFWMIPSALDQSVNDPSFQLAKVVTLLFGIGVTFRISNRVFNPILKGVFFLEVWAMLGRAGYLFLISPERLCTNYLISEQQLLGKLLLAFSLIWAVIWGVKVLFVGNPPGANA